MPQVSEQTNLTWETIGLLNKGNAGRAIDKALAIAVNDLRDRGEEDEKPRKVSIDVEMVVKDGMYIVTVVAQPKIPAHRTEATSVEVRFTRKDHAELFFQVNNPDRADQPTMEFDSGDGK